MVVVIFPIGPIPCCCWVVDRGLEPVGSRWEEEEAVPKGRRDPPPATAPDPSRLI